MLPPWAAYPLESDHGRWTQGFCEGYYHSWFDWYGGLSESKQLEYQRGFPPPTSCFVPLDNFYEHRQQELERQQK